MAVLNGGSTAFEAAAFGKPVLCLGPSKYQESGFSIHVNGPDEWKKVDLLENHDARLATRKVLRFLYTQMRRFPQFVDYVRADSTTRYRYYSGADVGRLEQQIHTGRVSADDTIVAESERYEDEVIDMMRAQRWAELAEWVEPRPNLEQIKIGRRSVLRLLDGLRDRLPRGDRG